MNPFVSNSLESEKKIPTPDYDEFRSYDNSGKPANFTNRNHWYLPHTESYDFSDLFYRKKEVYSIIVTLERGSKENPRVYKTRPLQQFAEKQGLESVVSKAAELAFETFKRVREVRVDLDRDDVYDDAELGREWIRLELKLNMEPVEIIEAKRLFYEKLDQAVGEEDSEFIYLSFSVVSD